MRAEQARARRDERAARRAARAAALADERSQRPTGAWAAARPASAGHQVSTAHFQAAYPAVAERGPGRRAASTSAATCTAGRSSMTRGCSTSAGVLSIANMLVLGDAGHGKSALTKSWMYRSRVFGRRCEMIDPKGEYAPLIQALGGVVLAFTPGGQTRLNPLTRIGTPGDARGAAAGDRARDARPAAAPGRGARPRRGARRRRRARRRGEVCIGHVVEQLRDPGRAHHPSPGPAPARPRREELREGALALLRLSHGPLRGMFDAPTERRARRGMRPRLCLDLSQVAAGAQRHDLALAIVMVCATAFLDAKRLQRAAQARAAGAEPREDDPRQRRVLAGAADRGPRRVLPVRVQARPRHRRAAHPRCTASQTSTPPATTAPASNARPGPPGRDGRRYRLPPAPRGSPPRDARRSASHSTEAQRIARLPAGRRAVAGRRPLL